MAYWGGVLGPSSTFLSRQPPEYFKNVSYVHFISLCQPQNHSDRKNKFCHCWGLDLGNCVCKQEHKSSRTVTAWKHLPATILTLILQVMSWPHSCRSYIIELLMCWSSWDNGRSEAYGSAQPSKYAHSFLLFPYFPYFLLYPTSDQTRLPATIKQITKWRKRS